MARGRPRKEPETHGNVTQATLLEYNDELTTALRVKKSADSAVANVYKRAEGAGLDRKTLKRAHADAQKAENERQVDDERYRRYMAWLNCPVGTQADLGLAEDDDDGDEAEQTANGEAVAKHENNMAFVDGVSAGRAGANAASNPHEPGSEEFQSFSSGWAAGQKEAVMSLSGAVRRAAR